MPGQHLSNLDPRVVSYGMLFPESIKKVRSLVSPNRKLQNYEPSSGGGDQTSSHGKAGAAVDPHSANVHPDALKLPAGL